jgi:hypothetical protein
MGKTLKVAALLLISGASIATTMDASAMAEVRASGRPGTDLDRDREMITTFTLSHGIHPQATASWWGCSVDSVNQRWPQVLQLCRSTDPLEPTPERHPRAALPPLESEGFSFPTTRSGPNQ